MDGFSPSGDLTVDILLAQAHQRFCATHPNLSPAQLEQRWNQTLATSYHGLLRTHSSQAPDVPRTMSYGTPTIAHPPSQNMDRIRSAPAAVPMARSSSDRTTMPLSLPTISTLPEQFGDSTNFYTLSSTTWADQQQSLLAPIDEKEAVGGIQVYSPTDYVNQLDSSLSANADLSQFFTPQWNPSLDGSTCPSTPASILLPTPTTLSSSDMSRQNSVNTQFMGDLSMLRVDSVSSSSSVSVLEEDQFPYVSDVDAKNINVSSFFPSFTGSPSERDLSAVSSGAAAAPFSFSSETQSYLVEDMRRSASVSSISSGASSSCSNHSRHSRRDKEIIAQSSRPIAPKAMEGSEAHPAPSNAQMTRVRSQDGSSKEVGVLPKQQYVRPSHPKIRCELCNANPEGFRGEHELRRHHERAHAEIKRVWICVDASADKKFLANCKHCRNRKQYGAYYNAAAHLRRAHFNPRKRGRKGKHDEKRGGIGGGDKPPMDELKARWMRELEVPNIKASTKSASRGVAINKNNSINNVVVVDDVIEADDDDDDELNNCETMPSYDNSMYQNMPDMSGLHHMFGFDASAAAVQQQMFSGGVGEVTMENFSFDMEAYMPSC